MTLDYLRTRLAVEHALPELVDGRAHIELHHCTGRWVVASSPERPSDR